MGPIRVSWTSLLLPLPISSVPLRWGKQSWNFPRRVSGIAVGDRTSPRNFRSLVLGCVDADICDQILIGKLVTRSISYQIDLLLHLSSRKCQQFVDTYWQTSLWFFDFSTWHRFSQFSPHFLGIAATSTFCEGFPVVPKLKWFWVPSMVQKVREFFVFRWSRMPGLFQTLRVRHSQNTTAPDARASAPRHRFLRRAPDRAAQPVGSGGIILRSCASHTAPLSIPNTL